MSSLCFANKEIVPIPIKAAATNLAIIGSDGRLKKFRVCVGINIRGIAKIKSTMKFILNQIKKNKFKILGGLWKNEYKDANFIMELSRLPSKEMIYGNLLMALNSPLKRLVGVLEGGIGNFIRVLDQIVKLKA